ncbi:hypothetical protein ALQ60_101564 [Pseudomonas syringae pv. papulans]|nr:hypothetical protein ALQ60_101564 [Pseudomonas syringae pv. papulans]RMV47662.1 hypothetical protein ALP11_101923 [Pseudomonas syringae pv. papulans]
MSGSHGEAPSSQSRNSKDLCGSSGSWATVKTHPATHSMTESDKLLIQTRSGTWQAPDAALP